MKELTKNNLLESIEREIDYFESCRLEINPDYAPRQIDIINLADLYYMSKYRDSCFDALGQRLVFYNICVLPVEVAAKMMDIDTKNIYLMGEDNSSYWTAWLKGKELQWWLKENYFGRQLNLYPLFLAKYGHLFVKKVGKEVLIVNPKNIIVRPDAEKLEETPIIEYHKMKKDAYYALAEKLNWENYKLNADEEEDGEVEFFEVYYPENFWKSKKKYNYFIVRPAAGNWEDGEIMAYLNSKPIYKDLAWEKIPGRFLGRGQIEKLFEDQIYLNRIANYKSSGLHWTSKHLFQTRDTSIARNLPET